MIRSIATPCGIALTLLFSSEVRAAEPADVKAALSIVQKHCVECHGADVQRGGVRFDKLSGDPTEANAWSAVLHQVQTGMMPPKKKERLSVQEVGDLNGWFQGKYPVVALALARKMERPENGNYIPHDVLFDPKTAELSPKIAASPARLWRTLPVNYTDKMNAWFKSEGTPAAEGGYVPNAFQAPFGLHSAPELKNYSCLYTLEGPQTAGLANNARLALIRVLDANPKDDKSLIRKLARDKEPPAAENLDTVIVKLYRHWLGRAPDEKELAGKRAIVLERIKKLGNRDGLIAGLVPIMILPEVVFHTELGAPTTPGEPSLLTPEELIDALDRALRDRLSIDPSRNPDSQWQITWGQPIARDFLELAKRKGKLGSREDVIAVLDEICAHKKLPRLSQSVTVQRFLAEYFNYTHYFNVFKCVNDLAKERDAKRLLGAFDERFDGGIPEKVVVRTRESIDKILEDDKNVLAVMLTIRTDYLGRSDAAFEAFHAQEKKRLEGDVQAVQNQLARKDLTPADRIKQEKELERRNANLATFMDKGRDRIEPLRTGVLTQRSWLVSHSTNVENHAIHRGKWIRERLLGGRIQDVPITVDASLPEDPKKTLRERMEKTRGGECWKCHRLMDPMGLPFEQYDHFGSFRKTELDRPVDVSGEIIESGDPKLDGPIAGPEELVKKLAASERVQQVFVRYAFRFWMGRNETLDDARTIQNAYRAYKESGGSISALLRSLLTSDAFLYRIGSVPKGDSK